MKGRYTWLRKLGKIMLFIVLSSAVMHGIATFIEGRRYAASVEKIKAAGSPISWVELAGAPVPDDENAAVVYSRIFREYGWDKSKSKQGQESEKQLDALDAVLTKEGVNSYFHARTPDVIKREHAPDLMRSDFWARAKRALAYYAGLLPMAREAASKPECRFKVRWQDGFEAQLPHYGYLRKLVRVLSAQAILSARDGKMDEALETILVALKVSKQANGDSILIGTLVESACTKMACAALLDVLSYGTPSGSQAASLYAELADNNYSREFAASIDSERVLGIWFIDRLRKDGPSVFSMVWGDKVPVKPGLTSKLLAVLLRPWIYADGVTLLGYMEKQSEVKSLPYYARRGRGVDNLVLHYPWYAITTKSASPRYDRARAWVDETAAEAALAQVVLMAQQSKVKLGQYPLSLEDLRSKMAMVVPTDPYSGKDLFYSRTKNGFQVYSIGMNLKDDKGAPITGNQDAISREVQDVKGDLVVNWTH